MSETIVIEDNVVNATVNVHIEENIEESKALLETTNDVVIGNTSVETKTEDVKQLFIELVEKFLLQPPKNMSIKLSPGIHKNILLICKELPEIFKSVESSLNNIISDNKINTKDIPEILVLVNKVYCKINNKKTLQVIVEPYELLKKILHIGFVVYVEHNKIENSELLLTFLNIIDTSIDLIKLRPSKQVKVGCFTCIL